MEEEKEKLEEKEGQTKVFETMPPKADLLNSIEEDEKALEELKEQMASHEEAPKEEQPTRSDLLEENREKEKKEKNKKILWIVGGVILLLLLILVIVLLVFKKDKKEPTEREKPDSPSTPVEEKTKEEIMQEYGQKIEELVATSAAETKKLPKYSEISPYAKVADHEIVCEKADIYPTGKVYLADCTIDGSTEKYTYGEKVEDVTSRTLTIYKTKEEYGDSYSFTKGDKSEEVGKIVCEKDGCTGLSAYHGYAFIKEVGSNSVLLYDYTTNTKLLDDLIEYEYMEISSGAELYAVYSIPEKSTTNYLYSIASKKKIRNVEGDLIEPGPYIPAEYAYEAGSVCYQTSKNVNCFDLKTSSLAFSLPGQFYNFFKGENSKDVYIGIGSDDSFKIYNQSGKAVFGGENVTLFSIFDKNFVTATKTGFKVYDANQKLLYTSKEYTSVELLVQDYVVVSEGTSLNLVDYAGNTVHTFLENWDREKEYFHTMLSGWYEEKGKNGIYLIIQSDSVPIEDVHKENPDMSIEELKDYDLGYEYYYIPSTKESGKIATYIGGYAKPILYLYPTVPTVVTVTFQHPERLTTTYPKYQESWKVLASPNGNLLDENQKSYYALYWEELASHPIDFKEGFYVEKEDAIPFLEEKLTQLGFNDRERNEFIMYWLPILEKNEKSLVYFELTQERNLFSPIHISPAPDSLLRVAIHVKKVDKKVSLPPQTLKPFQRTGFTVVEWGGVVY